MYISLNNKNYEYNINLFQSFYSIKQDINNNLLQKKNIKVTSDNLIFKFKGVILEDNKTPKFYKIKENDTINLLIKNEGGNNVTAGSIIGLIVFIIIILFIFIPAILLGVIPFLTFLFSRIFVKGLNAAIDVIRGFLDPNNWIDSFLSTLKTVVIPFMGFILKYLVLIVFTFFTTFFCTYYIYAFIYKDCRAYKASRLLAYITTAVLVMIYFMAALPSMVKSVSDVFLPKFISSTIGNAVNLFNDFKLRFIGAMPYVGVVVSGFINVMAFGFDLLNKTKFYGPKALYEWDKMYKFTLMPNVDLQLRQAKLRQTINGIEASSRYEEGKTVGDTLFGRFDFDAFIFVRFGFQTLVHLFIQFIDLFDLCGDKPESIIAIEQNIRKTNGLIETITDSLNDPSTPNKDKKDMRQSLINLSKTAAKLQVNKEKEEGMKVLDVDCLKGILINGAAAGPVTLFLFILIFILFCFPPMLAKVKN